MRQSVHNPTVSPRQPHALIRPHAVALACSILCLAQATVAAEAAPAELPMVAAVSTTPLPGIGLSRALFPAPVQSAPARELLDSGALDLSEFLNRRLGSVHVNEVQGNPYMMDVNYRGYTASPLLGTPQGLSVYVDGVR